VENKIPVARVPSIGFLATGIFMHFTFKKVPLAMTRIVNKNFYVTIKPQ
jgi:hypothetical protein